MVRKHGQEKSYMNGIKVFVDTNIFVYAFDRNAKEKHRIAANIVKDLWRSGNGIISTQVLQELFVILTKKIPHPIKLETAREIIIDLSAWDVVINNVETILSAIEIQKNYGYSFWDSLIIASALTGGAEVLLSEDLSDNRIINKNLKIKNPFIP